MRVFRTILGMLLLTIGLPSLLVGAALWAAMQHRDPGGAFRGDLQRLATPGYAIVIPDVDRLLRSDAPFARIGDTRLGIAAGTAYGPAFLGIAPTADVRRYLTGVPHTEVRGVDIGTGALLVATGHVAGRRPPTTPPAGQRFWTLTGGGALQWAPRDLDDRPYSLVVMNPGARPGVHLAAAAEVRPGWLNSSAWGLLTLGSLLMMVSVMALVWPSRRREVVYIVEPSQVPDLMQAIGAPLPFAVRGARQPGAHRPRTLAEAEPPRPPALPQFDWPPAHRAGRAPAPALAGVGTAVAEPISGLESVSDAELVSGSQRAAGLESIPSPAEYAVATAIPARATPAPSGAAAAGAAVSLAGSGAATAGATAGPAASTVGAVDVSAGPQAAVVDAAVPDVDRPAGEHTPAPGRPLNLVGLGEAPVVTGLLPGLSPAQAPLPGRRPGLKSPSSRGSGPGTMPGLPATAAERRIARRQPTTPTDLPVFQATAVGAWVAATAPVRARQTEAQAAARLAEAARNRAAAESGRTADSTETGNGRPAGRKVAGVRDASDVAEPAEAVRRAAGEAAEAPEDATSPVASASPVALASQVVEETGGAAETPAVGVAGERDGSVAEGERTVEAVAAFAAGVADVLAARSVRPAVTVQSSGPSDRRATVRPGVTDWSATGLTRADSPRRNLAAPADSAERATAEQAGHGADVDQASGPAVEVAGAENASSVDEAAEDGDSVDSAAGSSADGSDAAGMPAPGTDERGEGGRPATVSPRQPVTGGDAHGRTEIGSWRPTGSGGARPTAEPAPSQGRASLHAAEAGRPDAASTGPDRPHPAHAPESALAGETAVPADQPRSSMHAVEAGRNIMTVAVVESAVPAQAGSAEAGTARGDGADHPLSRAQGRLAGRPEATPGRKPAVGVGRRAPASWLKAAENVAARAAAEAAGKAGPEAGAGASPEAGAGASPEAVAETSPDAVAETSPDAEVGPEAGAGASPEAGAEASPEAVAETSPDAVTKTSPDAEVGPEVVAETSPDAEVGPEAVVEASANAVSGSGSEPVAGNGSPAVAEAGSGMDPKTDRDVAAAESNGQQRAGRKRSASGQSRPRAEKRAAGADAPADGKAGTADDVAAADRSVTAESVVAAAKSAAARLRDYREEAASLLAAGGERRRRRTASGRAQNQLKEQALAKELNQHRDSGAARDANQHRDRGAAEDANRLDGPDRATGANPPEGKPAGD